LIYINNDKIPIPVELKTFDFIITSGVDIDLKSNEFSISYISSEETGNENDNSNANKNLFNVKSNTLNKTFEKIQSLTNKSFNDSHLEYILIGENTAKENLDYFIDYYSKNPNIRLDVYAFITKDMSSEDFIKKILTSKIDTDVRLDGLVNDKTRLNSMTKKNLKDIMQLFYSENKTGLIPVLAVKESPIKNNDEKSENKYTFEFSGLGIIKNGKLINYLPYSLVRTYIILTKTLKMSDIEIINDNNLFVFTIKNSNNKISFKFNENNIPEKVIFDINIETALEETKANEKNNLNELQSEKIKSEIKEIIKISKKTNADFLNIGETLSMQHPYKWHIIKDDWSNIFKDLEYEINVTTKRRN
jgi:spore germination protein KC